MVNIESYSSTVQHCIQYSTVQYIVVGEQRGGGWLRGGYPMLKKNL